MTDLFDTSKVPALGALRCQCICHCTDVLKAGDHVLCETCRDVSEWGGMTCGEPGSDPVGSLV